MPFARPYSLAGAIKAEDDPKTDMVSYEGKDKEGKPVKVSYQRSQLSSQSDAIKNEIDPAFSNGQYWTLLPSTSYGTARL